MRTRHALGVRRMVRTAGVATAGVGLMLSATACGGEDEPSAPTSSSPSAPGAEAPEDASSGTSSPGAAPTASAPPSISAKQSDPKGGKELPDAPEAPDTLPGLPAPTDPSPVATTPWPEAASARGRVVAGFPEALRPLSGSTVLSSSVSPADARMQVALEATSPRSRSAVLRGYRKRLAPHGLVEEPAPSVAGSRTVAFRSGSTALTVTVTRSKGRTRYTVYGVVGTDEG